MKEVSLIRFGSLVLVNWYFSKGKVIKLVKKIWSLGDRIEWIGRIEKF